MDSSRQHTESSLRKVFILVSIGAGLIGLGTVLILQLKDNYVPASSADFAAVPVEVDFPSPELGLITLNGDPVSLSDYRGRIVLVNLWATWCWPCLEEMPLLQTFYEKYAEQGFVLIAINQEETRDVVGPFIQELGLTFPIWLDEDYLSQREFETAYLPSSYVVDSAGRVRLMWIGGISRQNLEKYVPPLIMEQ